MLNEIPFQLAIDPTAIAGAGLWSLVLYLGFSLIGDWVIEQIYRWFNFAERSLQQELSDYIFRHHAKEFRRDIQSPST